MKKHNGMRPQDVVILLKLILLEGQQWYVTGVAFALGISQSEVSESLNRSFLAGLLASDKRTVMKGALLEFLQHGLKYVYPQKPGAIVRGMRTAHSAEPLKSIIQSEETYVWPSANGKDRGQSIEPLHAEVPEACLRDNKLYELLALVDALRVGKVREQNIAIKELTERINKL